MSDFVPVGMQDILHSSKPGVREGKIKPLRLRKRVWRMLQSLFFIFRERVYIHFLA